ncbi:hypothetical protein [Streptomyces sp.]|uniref:hypothetical protein n=1 Tax=Streptomyces sp. TaxID=1931 RepID=UPI002D2BBDE6|nr:hypothetical protein [Streptomyces sp.]HZF90783.1 hypothetical protein [Streptomyces sp.]
MSHIRHNQHKGHPTARPARGRHRRPRPRKLLLTAGGLAVAAAVLSLVRLSAEPGDVDGLGPVRTGPSQDAATTGDTGDRAANTAASLTAAPEDRPSAPSAQGGAAAPTGTTGTSGTSGTSGTTVHVPTATDSPTDTGIAAPDATTIPRTPNPPSGPGTTAAPPAPAGSPAPRPKPKPAPTPAPTTGTPAPERPDEPGFCIPVVGLCVDPLNEDRDR